MLKDITPRLYQETIFSKATLKNCLVILPTGLGKTTIALMLAAYRLRQYPDSKILFLVPTKPLAEQHYNFFKKHLEINHEKLAVFTGSIKPEKRAALWQDLSIIFATPQGIENDIINNRINLENVSLIIFDEAHRAVGDYSYVFIAREYVKQARYARILALTASPGSEIEKIQEIIQNLFIEEIEIRTLDSPDVKPYVKEIDIKWIKVNLTNEFLEIKKYLEACLKERIKKIESLGFKAAINYTKKELLQLQAAIQARVASGNKEKEVMEALSVIAEIIKLEHALELLESQGIDPLIKYFNDLEQEALKGRVKATKNIVKDLNYRSAYLLATRLLQKKIEHPKLEELKKIIKNELINNEDIKIIVFTQFRDTANKIKEVLTNAAISSEIFIGQGTRREKGLTQKQQKEILERFKQGLFNVLIATSVAEEGIDIPKVDIVIFYEPIPSAIRQIQRRGRTGRQEKGRVIVLLTKDTRDEAYRWSAYHKERKMNDAIKNLRKKLSLMEINTNNTTLLKYIPDEEKPIIYADMREKSSAVVKELYEITKLKIEKLDIADYILSSRTAAEYKTKEDFVNSIIDGRLLQQAKKLKENFERPLIIVEGSQDIYSIRKIHPNAILGMLATLAIDYGISVIFTKNAKETASLLRIIAKREQELFGRDFQWHASKKPKSLKEQQEYIVSAFPGIGTTLAKPILKKFKTIKDFVNATEEELKEIEKIGLKKAREIKKIVEEPYDDRDKI